MWERRMWRHMDWSLLGVILLLQVMGLLTLARATVPMGLKPLIRQGIWMGLGWIIFFFVMRWDYQVWARWARWIYWGTIAVLVLVLLIGEERYGAQRWLRFGFFSVQPAEFAKVALIVTLATSLVENRERLQRLPFFIRTCFHLAPLFLLIFLQPDLGTSLVLILIWIGMLFFSGVPSRFLVAVGLIGLGLFGLGWKKGFIKDYQKQRLLAFLDPYSRANREGYHILQSQLAIGSGGLWGKGLFRGRMGKLGFVPAQHTDFIFTVVGEEGGFIGAAFVVLSFSFLLWRLSGIWGETENLLGESLLTGIFCFFFAHIAINIGMTLRLMPITGLPLPFFSAGGSNLVTTYFLLGLAQSVAVRRKRLGFR